MITKPSNYFAITRQDFVTRIKDNAVYEVEHHQIIEQHIHRGVIKDQIITLEVKEADKVSKLRLRKITFYDSVIKHNFEFLTNLFEMRADLVAAIFVN